MLYGTEEVVSQAGMSLSWLSAHLRCGRWVVGNPHLQTAKREKGQFLSLSVSLTLHPSRPHFNDGGGKGGGREEYHHIGLNCGNKLNMMVHRDPDCHVEKV